MTYDDSKSNQSLSPDVGVEGRSQGEGDLGGQLGSPFPTPLLAGPQLQTVERGNTCCTCSHIDMTQRMNGRNQVTCLVKENYSGGLVHIDLPRRIHSPFSLLKQVLHCDDLT